MEPEQLQDLLRGLIEQAAKPAAPTLSEFGPRWITEYARANRQKPRGVSSKESHLRVHLYPRFGAKRLDELRDEDIQQFKGELSDRNSKTVNNVLSTLSMCLKTAKRWRVIDRLPCTIELLPAVSGVVAFYEFDDYASLLRHAEQIDARVHLAVLLGGDAGLRLSEMIALEWTDLDLIRGLLHVQRSESKGKVSAPKSGKTRTVPLTQELARVLKLIPRNRPGVVRVLLRDDGAAVSEQTLRTWISKAQAGLGRKAEGLHILRHTFCSHLAMRGVTLPTIQRLAGHASIRTTMRYIHVADTEVRRAIQVLDAARGHDGNPPTAAVLPVSPTGFENVVGLHCSENSTLARTPKASNRPDSRRDAPSDALSLWRDELGAAHPPPPKEPTCDTPPDDE